MKEINQLEIFLKYKKGLSEKKIKYYIFWLNKFFAYYSKSLDNISEQELIEFCDLLKSKGYEDWQVKQAREAVVFYIQNFLNKMILPGKHTDIKTDSEPPVLTTWDQAKERFIERIRLRYYSYNTEKTYQEWIRRFKSWSSGSEKSG